MNRSHPESPQLESGYTRIANGLLKGILHYPLSGGELKLVLAVIRLTYGWHRKEAVLKIRELALVSGLSQRHAKRLIKSLVRDRVLIRRPVNRAKVVIGLNKEFSTWLYRSKGVTHNVPTI